MKYIFPKRNKRHSKIIICNANANFVDCVLGKSSSYIVFWERALHIYTCTCMYMYTYLYMMLHHIPFAYKGLWGKHINGYLVFYNYYYFQQITLCLCTMYGNCEYKFLKISYIYVKYNALCKYKNVEGNSV